MNSRSAGFVLIELLAVLVLISLVLAVAAVFTIDSIGAGRLNSAAREVVAAMRQAQGLARTAGAEQAVSFEIDRLSYSLAAGGSRSLPQGVAMSVVDSANVTHTSGTVAISFRPFGTAEPGTIVLGHGRKTVRVVVDPLIGALVQE